MQANNLRAQPPAQASVASPRTPIGLASPTVPNCDLPDLEIPPQKASVKYPQFMVPMPAKDPSEEARRDDVCGPQEHVSRIPLPPRKHSGPQGQQQESQLPRLNSERASPSKGEKRGTLGLRVEQDHDNAVSAPHLARVRLPPPSRADRISRLGQERRYTQEINDRDLSSIEGKRLTLRERAEQAGGNAFLSPRLARHPPPPYETEDGVEFTPNFSRGSNEINVWPSAPFIHAAQRTQRARQLRVDVDQGRPASSIPMREVAEARRLRDETKSHAEKARSERICSLNSRIKEMKDKKKRMQREMEGLDMDIMLAEVERDKIESSALKAPVAGQS